MLSLLTNFSAECVYDTTSSVSWTGLGARVSPRPALHAALQTVSETEGTLESWCACVRVWFWKQKVGSPSGQRQALGCTQNSFSKPSHSLAVSYTSFKEIVEIIPFSGVWNELWASSGLMLCWAWQSETGHIWTLQWINLSSAPSVSKFISLAPNSSQLAPLYAGCYGNLVSQWKGRDVSCPQK